MTLELVLIFIIVVAFGVLFKKNNDRYQNSENEIKALGEKIKYSRNETLHHADEINNILSQKMEIKIRNLADIIEKLYQENKLLRDELKNTEEKLNFYANIEEDSKYLTIDENEEERKRALEIAKTQILDNREKFSQGKIIGSMMGADRKENEQQYGKLDPEQEKATQYMDYSKENLFITGKAGTGKSYLLDAFVSLTKKSNIVLAPTGIAALKVRGATIHSTFGYYNLVNLSVEDICENAIRLKSEKKLVLKNVQMIIIDEISMVRVDTFDKIDRILRVINNCDIPFGGKQMIVFGDLFQLPPVTKGKEYEYLTEKYGGIYFYNSNAYKEGNFKFIELTINHRQNGDQRFFEILNRVREGKVTDSDIDILNQRVSLDESFRSRFTTLFPTKAEAELANQSRLEMLDSKEFVYHAEVVFEKNPNKTRTIESSFPITEVLRLKQGALVMMTANDPDHRWVNGTLGIVNKLTEEAIFVSIKGETFEVPKCEFTEQEVNYIDGKITYEDVFSVSQYPIVLAYAITIHKSQGQTYKNIVCDIDNCFASGQAYVALSRCASLDGLHLKNNITPTNIQVDHNVLNFYISQTENNVI